MKKKDKLDLKKLSMSELATKVDGYRRELFSTRLTMATKPTKDKTIFRKLRKDIARVLTLMRQKSVSP